ncbi:unnamed protein product [Amoebophrya sp. A25]|nr:unnamed protein product [Amoebophrya sp. A25]CAD7974570.1 unnamed protein product [Amoebophrya sp. A25]|eukprot:GSA25T00002952001.1
MILHPFSPYLFRYNRVRAAQLSAGFLVFPVSGAAGAVNYVLATVGSEGIAGTEVLAHNSTSVDDGELSNGAKEVAEDGYQLFWRNDRYSRR